MSTTPTIVFQANLTLNSQEYIGPLPTSTLVAVLPPDRYSEDQTAAVASIAQRANLISTFLPDLLRDNKFVTNGETFTLVGQDALYVRNAYGIGYAPIGKACLTIVSQTN